MSNQPDWECVGQLGDANPLDHGGYWIFRDKTGVYDPEGEYLEVWEDENTGRTRGTAYRFCLEPCTYTPKLFGMSVLSDNKFHPDHPAWFASPEGDKVGRPQDSTYLSNIASCMDTSVEELVKLFTSNDILERAQAWRMVGEFHGFDNLDNYPLQMSRSEMAKRYRLVRYRSPK